MVSLAPAKCWRNRVAAAGLYPQVNGVVVCGVWRWGVGGLGSFACLDCFGVGMPAICGSVVVQVLWIRQNIVACICNVIGDGCVQTLYCLHCSIWCYSSGSGGHMMWLLLVVVFIGKPFSNDSVNGEQCWCTVFVLCLTCLWVPVDLGPRPPFEHCRWSLFQLWELFELCLLPPFELVGC